jgi:hypothetical protein
MLADGVGAWLFAFLLVTTPVRGDVIPATDVGIVADNTWAWAINNEGRIAVSYESYPYVVGASILLPSFPGPGSRIDIDCSPGCFHEAIVPWDISPSGRVVGTSAAWPTGGPGIYQAESWTATGSSEWLPSGSYSSDAWIDVGARGVNGRGEIVGNFAPSGFRPVYWPDSASQPIILPNYGPSQGPYPQAINLAGVIVGRTKISPTMPAVWTPGPSYTLDELPLLPGGSSARAMDINNAGHIVGAGDDGTGSDTALMWRPEGGGNYGVIALPRLEPGDYCEATAINGAGEAVGRCTDSGGSQRGVVWDASATTPTVLHVLTPLGGETELTVRDVNDSRKVVGWSGSATFPSYPDDSIAVSWTYPPRPGPEPSPVPALSLPALALLALACLAGTSHRRVSRSVHGSA